MEIGIDVIGKFGDLIPNLSKVADTTDKVRSKTTSMNDEFTKAFQSTTRQAKEFGGTFLTSAQQIDLALGKVAAGLEKVSVETGDANKDLKNTIDLFNNLADATVLATEKFITGSTKKEIAIRKEIGTLRQLQEAMTKANDPVKGEQLALQVGEQTKKVQQLAVELNKIPKEPLNTKNVKSFTQEIKLAELQVRLLQKQASQGLIPQTEVLKAKQNVANLKQEMKDLQQEISALNPERKFEAVTQLASGIAGGFSAILGVFTLLNIDSEQFQKQLVKIQSVLAISQGLNQLLGFAGAFKNVTTVLGLTSAASQALEEDTISLGTEIVNTAKDSKTLSDGFDLAVKKKKALSDLIKGDTKIVEVASQVTEVNTVVTEVNSGAQVQNAAAKKGVTYWTQLATIATNGFTTAIKFLTGPIGITIALVTAAYFALRSYADSGIDLEKVLGDLDKAQKQFDNQLSISKQRFADENKIIQANIDLLRERGDLKVSQAGGTKTTKGEEISDAVNKEVLNAQQEFIDKQLRDNEQIARINEAKVKSYEDANKKILEDLQKNADVQSKFVANPGLQLLGGVFTKSDKDVKELADKVQANKDAADQILRDNASLEADNEVLKSKREGLRLQFNKQEQTDGEAQNEKLIKLREDLKNKLLQTEKELQDGLNDLRNRSLRAEADGLTGQAQLEANRKIQQAEIDQLNINLIKKGQAEENARAALEGRKAQIFKLGLEQEQQLEILRIGIEKKFLDDSAKLAEENARVKIEATEKGLQKELDLYDNAFPAKKKKLLEQGFSEQEITALQLKEKNEIRIKAGTAELQIIDDTNKDIIDAIELAGVNEALAEKIRNEKKLEVDLEFQQARLKLITDNGGSAAELAEVNARIAELKRLIKTAQKEIIADSQGFSLAKLFGVDAEHADEFNAAAERFVGGVVQLSNVLLQSALDNVSQQLDLNQQIIDDYNRRIDETQNAVDAEYEKSKQGLANNYGLRLQEQAQLKAARDKELAEQKRLLEEKRKLAKEQAIIEGVAQASSLTTTAVNTLKGFSELPLGIGVLLGLSAVAGLIAGFIGIKSKIAAASTVLAKGGAVGGKSHAEGGNKYRSINDHSDILEIEAGEFVTNKGQYSKHKELVEAVNNEKYNSLDLNKLMPFLKKSKISLSTDNAKPILESRNRLNNYELHYHTSISYGKMEEAIREGNVAIHKEVSELNKRDSEKPEIVVAPDGTVTITHRKGNNELVRIIKPNVS